MLSSLRDGGKIIANTAPDCRGPMITPKVRAGEDGITTDQLARHYGLERAAKLFDMGVPEVKNRATNTGAIEIGRYPGVVRVAFRAPIDKREKTGLLQFALDQYGEP